MLYSDFLKNKKYIYISLIILFFTMLPQFLTSPSLKHYITLLVLSIVLILSAITNRFLFFIFISYINLINIIQVHISLHWGLGETLDRISVALQSPRYETIEYLSSYINKEDYFIILYSIILIIITYYFIKSYKYIFNSKYIKITSLIIILFLLFLLNDKDPMKVIIHFSQAKSRANILVKRKNFIAENDIKIKNIKNTIYDKVVIIQGESANKNYMNLYGYDVLDTPFLTSLKDLDGFYKFNTISPANNTRYSISMLYTKANVKNWEDNFINSLSIVSKFKEYGYYTHWISNQGERGRYNDYITSIAYEANHKLFYYSFLD